MPDTKQYQQYLMRYEDTARLMDHWESSKVKWSFSVELFLVMEQYKLLPASGRSDGIQPADLDCASCVCRTLLQFKLASYHSSGLFVTWLTRGTRNTLFGAKTGLPEDNCSTSGGQWLRFASLARPLHATNSSRKEEILRDETE